MGKTWGATTRKVAKIKKWVVVVQTMREENDGYRSKSTHCDCSEENVQKVVACGQRSIG